MQRNASLGQEVGAIRDPQRALDVLLDELLFNDRRAAGQAEERTTLAPDPLLQRAGQRKRIRLASGVVWERLTPLSEPDTEFLHVTYEVGGASSAETELQRHPGHEWGFVLEGRLEVRIGFEEHVLEPGDSISFDSTIPHRLANVGDAGARHLVCTRPDSGRCFVDRR
jgi:quercetin dioxygenase-like cupin family protein